MAHLNKSKDFLGSIIIIITTTIILSLSGTLSWVTVRTSDSLTARAGHAAFFLQKENEEEGEEEIAVFGGGDNAGGYFNDLIIFSPLSC